ncbi:MAG: 5-deoxy-glucuronate isomerase, partial [Anaerolineae bacterium]|nr:5-deoxy-glucuronate isomerase [Anaerolineae bacterium]
MANLKFQYQPTPGLQKVVSSENSDLKYTSLSVLQLHKGQHYAANSGGQELGLVVMTGSVTVRAAGVGWENIGGRKHVFERPAHVVYVPCNTCLLYT